LKGSGALQSKEKVKRLWIPVLLSCISFKLMLWPVKSKDGFFDKALSIDKKIFFVQKKKYKTKYIKLFLFHVKLYYKKITKQTKSKI
jgi:hypothetical protein